MRAHSVVVVMGALLIVAAPAWAIPSFARKYGTSCTTCHTVYPKLTPFGEAFRRNGFRFPGVDSDYVKQDVIALKPKSGADEDYGLNAVPPLSFGFNGQALAHPNKDNSGGAADNHAVFLTRDLVAEGHLWAGGSFSDSMTYFGEITFASDGTIAVEHAQVFANDLIGPKHAVNVRAGRAFSTLTSFGPHSSFLNDQIMPSSGMTNLAGATGGGWNVFDHFNGVEVNGVLGGRFDYSAGLNAGTSVDTRTSENFYGHVGTKLGGLALDGEGAGGAKDAMRPWEEQAVTLDAWVYRSVNSASFADPNSTSAAALPDQILLDSATVYGGNLRAQYNSLEVNGGAYYESHNRVQPDPSGATLGLGGNLTQAYAELSYIVQPWFVPALRVEYTSFSLDGGSGSIHNWRINPGIAAAVRPNIKLVLTADLESTNGAPPGGWGAVGGVAQPTTPDLGALEFENLQLFAAFAF